MFSRLFLNCCNTQSEQRDVRESDVNSTKNVWFKRMVDAKIRNSQKIRQGDTNHVLPVLNNNELLLYNFISCYINM